MTENEKLDLLIINMQDMKDEMQDIKEDVRGMKDEIQDIKEDVRGMKDEIQDMKNEIKGVKKDVNSLRRQVVKSVTELKEMDEMILDEVGRVHGFLEKHRADKMVHTVWS